MGAATWPLFFVCLVVAAGLLARFILVRQRGLLIASMVFLAASLGIVAADRLIITETKRVQAGLHALAKAVQEGQVARALEFFSQRDQADRELVQRAVGMVDFAGPIRITDLSIAMSSQESRAVSTFRASASAKFQGRSDRGHTRWELTWEREGNDWKIVRVRRLRFIGEGEASPLSMME